MLFPPQPIDWQTTEGAAGLATRLAANYNLPSFLYERQVGSRVEQ
jgi:hypothetical protein